MYKEIKEMKATPTICSMIAIVLLAGCMGGSDGGENAGSQPYDGDGSELSNNDEDQRTDVNPEDSDLEADFEVVGYYSPDREHPNDRPLKDTVFAAANDDGQAMVIWHELKHGASDPVFRSIRGDLADRQWDTSSLDQTPIMGEPLGVHLTESGETIVLTSVSGHPSLDNGSYAWHHNASTGWEAPMQVSGSTARALTATETDDLLLFTIDRGIQRYKNGVWQLWSDNQDISWMPLAAKGGHLLWVSWDRDDQMLNIWRTGQNGEAPISKETVPADKGEHFKVYPRGAISSDGAATVVWNDGHTLQFTHSPGPGESFGAAETFWDYRVDDIRMNNASALATDYGPEGDLFVASSDGGAKNSPYTTGPIHILRSSDAGQSWTKETNKTFTTGPITLDVSAEGELFIDPGRCDGLGGSARRALIKRDSEGRWSDDVCFGNSGGTFKDSFDVTAPMSQGGVMASIREMYGSEQDPAFERAPGIRSEREIRLWFYR